MQPKCNAAEELCTRSDHSGAHLACCCVCIDIQALAIAIRGHRSHHRDIAISHKCLQPQWNVQNSAAGLAQVYVNAL